MLIHHTGEWKTLLEIYPSYLQYCHSNPKTHLPRFYACVSVSGLDPKSSTPERYVLMTNVFDSPLPVHARYDLKGSTIGR